MSLLLLFSLSTPVSASIGGEAPHKCVGLTRSAAVWRESDAASALRIWLDARSDERVLNAHEAARLGQLLSVLNGEIQGTGDWADAAAAMLEATHWRTESETSSGEEPLPSRGMGVGPRVRRAARAAFARLLEGEHAVDVVAWLEREVITRRAAGPESRRAAIGWIRDERPPTLVPALLTVARDPDDPLRPEVLDLLVRWEDEAVDLFLVRLVGRPFDRHDERHPYTLLLSRVRDGATPLGERATAQLAERLRVMLLSHDWRSAARAVALAGRLESSVGVPLLLDALHAWDRRKAEGRGSRRILYELSDELSRISGRTGMGRDPRAWSTWWVAVQQGRTELHASGGSRGEARSSAAFFGLHPRSDQVTFIIDRSGSMSTEWGTTGHDRYTEAVEQMTRFLQASGPATRFNVILFSDSVERSSLELVPATAKNLSSARRSLLARGPNGGTSLRPAVDMALGLKSGNELDLDQVMADTVVVLCDGQTSSGPGWVAPLIEEVGEATQVVFECVLIGSNGDGTLQALAQETGGGYLRVDG